MFQLVHRIGFSTPVRNVCFSIAFAITPLFFPSTLLAHNATFNPASGGLYIPAVEVPNPFGTGVDCYQVNLGLTNGAFSIVGAVPTDCGGQPTGQPTGGQQPPVGGISCSQFSSGTSDYNRCQTVRLQGTWSFTFTIINEYTNIYTLTNVEESSFSSGEFNIFGVDEYGNDDVITGYNPESDDFTLLDLGTEIGGSQIDHFFRFNFTSEDTVSGCYYMFIDGEQFGDCDDMIGTRTSVRSRPANNSTEEEQARQRVEEHRTLSSSKRNAPKVMDKDVDNQYQRLLKELTDK